MTTTLAPGTTVVVGWQLGWIVGESRCGLAAGYDVATDYTAPHFVAEHAVKVAEVGVNVCRTARGECWCGLIHVTEPERLVNPVHTPNDEEATDGC